MNFEIENVGERVAASKKRVTWRFVFKGSDTVHTISLEHSRMSAKKRVKLDGVQVVRVEKFVAGEWKYEFSFEEYPNIPFVIRILEIKKVGKKLNDMYRLIVDGKYWSELTDRDVSSFVTSGDLAKSDGTDSKWGSDSYARRISRFKEQLEENEVRITWIFTFGLNGEVHKLVLDHCDDGEKHVILNRREIHRTAQYTEKEWTFEHQMVNGHHFIVRIAPDRTYDLLLNGSKWDEIAETSYTLQEGWEPVHSKSTGRVYYRNDTTKETQWSKPLVEKSEQKPVDLPPKSCDAANTIDALQTTPTNLLEEQEKQLEQEEPDTATTEDLLPPPPPLDAADPSGLGFDPFAANAAAATEDEPLEEKTSHI